MQSIGQSRIAVAACALALVAGCGGDDDGAGSGTGTVQIFVEPEDTIPEGLEPGTGEENIADGWRVTYDRFLVTIGNVRAARSDAPQATLSDPSVFVLDLKNAPATRYVIAEFEGASAARWDRFGFDLPNAREGVKTLSPTTEDDVALMVDNGYSVFFEGSIEKEGGESCPPDGECVPAEEVRFSWGLSAGTSFEDCATEDELPGFSVPTGGTIAVKPTIHGDHWFFNNITAGVELTKRYAQYIADCDLDGDGETTIEELKQVKVADVFGQEYNLAGAIGELETAYDYVVAQARTLGDFQGDGECPKRTVLP
ncbi:hypothetical protein [Sorangium sp. So ce362]|uniref:hypothetical protein n=1 Tax=Sorangium sp. So ce362 TaxID=3133303 RepID=UPI003F61371F